MKILKFLTVIITLFTVALFAYRAGHAQGQALQVCVSVPAAQRARVLNAFTKAHRYEPKVKQADGSEADNPVTREAYMKLMFAEFVRQSVASVEANEAAEAARNAAVKKVADEVIIQE